MPITLNGSGTITGVSSLATALVNPIVTTTIGVGNATPSASGSGVSFPATQSASSNVNTLDDYEEGTFTPTAYGSSTVGTTTYTLTEGVYTKIGNVVTFSINVGWSNMTGTGNLLIGSLPFTVSTYSSLSVYNNGLAFTASSQLSSNLEVGTTYISMVQFTNAGVISSVPVDTSVSRLMISGSYFTAT
jgi:hypothetical protein